MKTTQIAGIVIIVIAGFVAYMGYAESQGLSSSLSSAFIGQPSDNVMLKYGTAAILGVVGFVLFKR